MTTTTDHQTSTEPTPLHDVAVKEIMHHGIVSCAQSAGPAEIARIMAGSKVHCVAVIGLAQGDRAAPVIWGIVSDLDLLQAAIGTGAPPTAATLARQPVISVRPTVSVHEAAQVMVANGVSHLVVVDPEELTPVGIVSSLDVAGVLADV